MLCIKKMKKCFKRKNSAFSNTDENYEQNESKNLNTSISSKEAPTR